MRPVEIVLIGLTLRLYEHFLAGFPLPPETIVAAPAMWFAVAEQFRKYVLRIAPVCAVQLPYIHASFSCGFCVNSCRYSCQIEIYE
jgi:hypothetical protein